MWAEGREGILGKEGRKGGKICKGEREGEERGGKGERDWREGGRREGGESGGGEGEERRIKRGRGKRKMSSKLKTLGLSVGSIDNFKSFFSVRMSMISVCSGSVPSGLQTAPTLTSTGLSRSGSHSRFCVWNLGSRLVI